MTAIIDVPGPGDDDEGMIFFIHHMELAMGYFETIDNERTRKILRIKASEDERFAVVEQFMDLLQMVYDHWDSDKEVQA